jgi:hypothetical protein
MDCGLTIRSIHRVYNPFSDLLNHLSDLTIDSVKSDTMKRKYLFTPILILFSAWISNPLYPQDSSIPEKEASGIIDAWMQHLNPRKVYLHLNKNNFHAGDAIWFQAYLMDGRDHVPDTSSTNVYIDLVNGQGVMMAKRILLAENGRAEGDISLPYDMPDGNYMIRAYTDWMRNFDEDFYFSRHLYIHNPAYANMIPRSEIRSNRRFNRHLEELGQTTDIVFSPEGGQLIGGIPVTIAFRAFNGLGSGVDVKGEVLEGNDVIAEFESGPGGFGSFEIKPVAGMEYTARVSFDGSRSRRISLPEVAAEGATLRVRQDEENVNVEVFSAGESFSSGNSEVLLLVHTRGEVVANRIVSLHDGSAGFPMPKDNFPSGISHITLFSPDLVPLSERLVFIDHQDALIFTPAVTRQVVNDQEYFVLSLNITDHKGNPVSGNFSLSVFQGYNPQAGSRGNIYSYMLLDSDLPGVIPDIHNYLDPENDSLSIDDIMLTLEWQRFGWDEIISGQMPEYRHQSSSSLAISGSIMHPSENRALPNFPVRLDIRGKNRHFETNTSSDGTFLFDDLVFYDDTNIKLSSNRRVSASPPTFELRSEQITGIGYVPSIYTLPKQVTRRGSDWSRTPGAGRSPLTAIRDRGVAPSQYGVADQTIFIDPDPRQTTMYDILITRIRGLNHNLQFRGPTSMQLSNAPTFMLDGTEIAQRVFLSLDPRYVQRLEVFSGPRASIFGVRGAAGAILAYSRRPADPGMPDHEEYLIQGYHSAREFSRDVLPFYSMGDRQGIPERSLLWSAGLQTDDSGNITVTLPVPERSGIMTIIIEGTAFGEGFGSGVFLVEL